MCACMRCARAKQEYRCAPFVVRSREGWVCDIGLSHRQSHRSLHRGLNRVCIGAFIAVPSGSSSQSHRGCYRGCIAVPSRPCRSLIVAVYRGFIGVECACIMVIVRVHVMLTVVDSSNQSRWRSRECRLGRKQGRRYVSNRETPAAGRFLAWDIFAGLVDSPAAEIYNNQIECPPVLHTGSSRKRKPP